MARTRSPASGARRRARAHLHRDVVPGVHRLELAHVNSYLIADGDSVTVVDAGLPAMWQPLHQALAAIGSSPDRVAALVLTHAHFDHLGCARAIAERWRVPVWAHIADHELARQPYRYAHERPRALYPIRSPRAVPILGAMLAAGALRVPHVTGLRSLEPGMTLPVPGLPTVLFTPGHTYGHCALVLEDRDAVLSGDAVVTLDPYTARVGPRIVAGAATADSDLNLRSLEGIAESGVGTVLPGHGEPWRAGARAAVAQARMTGPS
ncbi:MAG: MBL fold metallo-hydrolase [Micrococcales bacterium]|nr:MBL fold metallo-hydrolase [Micrococcales bacterium]